MGVALVTLRVGAENGRFDVDSGAAYDVKVFRRCVVWGFKGDPLG